MIFYIVLALIITGLIGLANKSSHSISILCRFLSVFLAAIIGGLRDTTIGTDMAGYGTVYFEEAQNYSSYINFILDWQTTEYAYATLCYLGKTIYNDIHSYLFLSEFIKIVLVISTVWHFRKRINPCLIVFVYMLFAYWYGLSLMRQSLALCCCFYSLTFFFDKRYVRFCIWIVIAYLFHNSAIFFLYLPLITFIFNKTKHPILVSTIGILVLYGTALTAFVFLASTGLFREEAMELYLDSGVPTAKANIVLSTFILVIGFVLSKSKKLYHNINNKYIFFLVKVSSGLSLMFLFLATYFEVAFRVSFYMMYVLFITFPLMIESVNIKRLRKVLYVSYLFLVIAYYLLNANHGLADTIPYSSKILGI